MIRSLKRIVSILLVFTMLFPFSGFAETGSPTSPAPALDGTQSSWAASELLEAYGYGLTYPEVMRDFKKNITREEFCILAVKLYESLTGKTAAPAINPFTDTTNQEILKAYQLGIVRGVSETRFAPVNSITRQEICAMIYRALDASLPGLNKDTTGTFPFSDQGKIASWAMDSMKFAYKNQIMMGIGSNQIGPLQNTTREQAIVLMKRTYTNYSGSVAPSMAVGTISTIQPTLRFTSPLANYQSMEKDSLFFPVYDQRLTLTDSSYSTFIDQEISKKKWFAFKLVNATGAKKIHWQVSTSPFVGEKDGWKTPQGLIANGTAEPGSGGFQVDFGNLRTSTTGYIGSLITIPRIDLTTDVLPIKLAVASKPIPQQLKIYYVRGVAVDALGNPIGDPGSGIAVVYGKRVIDKDTSAVAKATFQVWTPYSSTGFYSGENQDRPSYKSTITIDPRNKENRLFHFNGIGSGYKSIVVQISTAPFPSAGGNWPETPNLIYEQQYTLPLTTLVSGYPNSVYVDFTKFAELPANMEAGKYIRYYLRGVAVKKSSTPGVDEVSYSSPITIEYGYEPPLTWYSDEPYKKTQVLQAALPSIKIKSYQPVSWPAKDYMSHYYVFQAPKAVEIKCNWKSVQTGEILYPYFTNIGYYNGKGISSPQEYETKMIPRVLPVGATVYFPPPKEEDKAWYQQLFEGIVNFFKDLGNVIKELANQVSTSYAKLKSDLIMFVVDLCPVESLKGQFKIALEGMVNAGLMSLGIPPTLPNFDELSEMSMDYLAEVALTEAGIPPTDWNKELTRDVAEGIYAEVEKATSYADVNPLDAPFLKLDPAHLYKPGSVEIEIYNNSTYPSVPGSFDLHVTFEMDYYNKRDPIYPLSLSVPNNYALGSGAGDTVTTAYRNHFEYGLNNNQINYVQGGRAVYDVFDPRIGVKVPRLEGGESTTVTVYLNPYSAAKLSRYPQGENLLAIDFENIYFNNGNKKFTYFCVTGRFPTAEEYLLSGSQVFYLDPSLNYAFANEGSSVLYDKHQKPVSTKWSK